LFATTLPELQLEFSLFRTELNEFMESQGAASPGLLVLTTGLSKPFRRLEKYAGMLQELERHVEENHPDRGDTQRSVSVYKDIAVSVFFFGFSQSRVQHQITNCLWHSMFDHHVSRLIKADV
jgi:hypothetical protein